jgi:hypothetical protein
MVNTPVFIGTYYGTKVGQSFAKVRLKVIINKMAYK